jgi:uncharacterized protein YidB (DUF937 family)
MGWREILNGMLNGPRGHRQPTKDAAGGGMSPIMMALLGYLAYKAFKGTTGGQSPITPDRSPNDRATNGELIDKLGRLLRSGKLSQSAENATVSGSIADMVLAGLKTVLGGAGAGAVLSGGLGTLIKEFQQRGQGPAAQTWVSTGPNRAIAPNELADALGNDTLDELSKQTGMRREAVIAELSKHLPQLIDQLTPNGRVPTIEEASRMVA